MTPPNLGELLAKGLCATKASAGISPHSSWAGYQAFVNFIASLRLRHFGSDELLFLGEQHAQGKCRGLNNYPPEHLWRNIAEPITVLDIFSEEFGAEVYILSAYRSPVYNACIEGAANNSAHMTFQAVDFFCENGSPSCWAAKLREYRAGGMFVGGIGTYQLFLHLDTAGVNNDWHG